MINIGIDMNRMNPEYVSAYTINIIKIIETQKDGEAELDFILPNATHLKYYKLEKENDHWLTYSVNKRCADGIIIAVDHHDNASVYIIELKASIRANKWSDILTQFRGALLRALSFCHTLGLKDIVEVRFYTACENHDKIDVEKHTRELQKNKLKGTIRKNRR